MPSIRLCWLNFAVGAYTALVGALFLFGYALPDHFAFREGVGWGLVFVLVGAYALYALWVVWVNEESSKKFERPGYIV